MGLRKRVEELENEAISAFHHSIELDGKIEALETYAKGAAESLSSLFVLLGGQKESNENLLEELQAIGGVFIEFTDKYERVILDLKEWKETVTAAIDVKEVKDWSDPVQVLVSRVSRLERLVSGRESEIAEMKGLLDTLKVIVMLGRSHADLCSVMESPEKRAVVLKEFDQWYEKLSD